jgi:glycosyltransferase involved in cell wall biosynthesis
MRVLLLTPALPYPTHQGGALRNFGVLRGLREAGHRISLFSVHDGTIPVAATPLDELCERIVTVSPPQRSAARRLRDLVLSGHPDLALRLETPESRERLRDLLTGTRFDLIQFEGLEMAIYQGLARQLQPQAKLIYDAHNAEHALQRVIARVEGGSRKRAAAALYSQVQARRIARFERAICASANAVIAVSQEDADALQAFRPNGKVYVLPNGIYADDYSDPPQQRLELGSHIMVFTGKMDYRPNVDAMLWFDSAILPLIQERIPDAKLYVVGQKPHASLHSLRDRDHVEVTGWVAEVQPFLHAAQVYVAPLRMGSGTRLKILEAMAAGCAVVATSVATSGLDAEAHDAMIVADDARAFAQTVIDLMGDPERRSALGEAARTVVRRRYDWSALIPCLLGIYKDLGLG